MKTFQEFITEAVDVTKHTDYKKWFDHADGIGCVIKEKEPGHATAHHPDTGAKMGHFKDGKGHIRELRMD